jgi:NADH-quinone oxidoreductase subunit J
MEFLVANAGGIVFWVFAVLMVVSAILVVTLRNPMYGAISLLVSFLSVAVLFLLREAEFLAGVQMFVYGGGIMVLFLFVIMLVNLQGLHESRRFLEQLPWALILVIAGVTLFGMIFAGAQFGAVDGTSEAMRTVDGEVMGNSEAVGWILYRDFLLPFEVASVFLLVAMIGAVVLGRRD